MLTLDEYRSYHDAVKEFETAVKISTLLLCGENPSQFDLDKMTVIVTYDNCFMVGYDGGKMYYQTADDVLAEAAKLPQFAVVTHTPTCADDIQVGDIYFASWGSTMTMNTYFKVVKRTKCFVTLRVLAKRERSDGFLSGYSMPLDKFEDWSNCYDDERFEDADGKVYAQRTVKVNPNGGTALAYKRFIIARPWNGKEKYFNHCD